MSRLQINDNFGGQQLQTMARPVAATEQAAMPVEDTRWKALANVFAQGEVLAQEHQAQKSQDDTEAAKKWAQSMTVSELGKAIKDGKMLPSQSPVFVGTAQHIWGVNTHEAGLRDMTSKLTTGELKFNSPAEADQYLTEWRNTALAGQSKYAVAGFDKGYAQARDKVMDHVTKLNDKEWVDNAQVQASDFLANSLNKVTSGDFKGTPQEAASALMQDYQLMRHTKTLPDGAAKGALGEVVARMAGAGHKDLTDAFLNSQMEGIGSVRGFLGEAKAQTLSNHAKTTFDGAQRKRVDDEILPFYDAASKGELKPAFREWATSPQNKDYTSSATIHAVEQMNLRALAEQSRMLHASQIEGAVQASHVEAERQVDAALAQGKLYTLMGASKPQVLDKQGSAKDADVTRIAEQVALKRTQGLPMDQQVGYYAQNGLENPDWKATIGAGLYNLNTIGVAANGKPTGQLNEAGKKSIELFKQISLYPDYARSVLGEKSYERFDNIAFLTRQGRSPDDAAGLAAAAASEAIVGSDTDKLVKKVHAEVGKIQSDPFYKFDWAQRLWGDNTNVNTAQMTGTLRRYATLLAHSGQYGDADSAIQAAAKYLADPQVTAKVNGTVYLRSEMPTGPKSRTQDEWFDRFITEVPKARAKELGFKPSEVRMEYDPTIRAYRGFVGGVPMENPDRSLWVMSKDDIQKWYGVQDQIDVTNATAKPQAAQAASKGNQAFAARVSAKYTALNAGDSAPYDPATDGPRKAQVTAPKAPPKAHPLDNYWQKPGASPADAERLQREQFQRRQ